MSLTKTELKDIQSLLSKKGRKLKKQYLAEGVRLLEEAVRHKVRPENVYYSETILSERAQLLLNIFRAQHVQTTAIPNKQFEALTDTKSPQGVLAVFSYPTTHLAELYHPDTRKVLLCENISDPGNLGTLIRSALAFDFDIVVLSGLSAEPYAPKVVRASVGAVFGLPIAVADSAEVVGFIRQRAIAMLAADIGGAPEAQNFAELANQPLLLAIGSESHGLSEPILNQATLRIKIAHSELVESLNAAVAGSILMKELYDLTR